MASDPRINSLLDQANDLFLKKKFSESISFYEEILNSDSENLSALNNIGYALSKSGKYEDALFFYNKALKKYPDDLSLLINTISCMRKLGKFSDALTHCDNILEKNPDYNVVLYHKERILTSSSKYDDSIRCCDAILKDYPENADVLFDKAKNLALLKNTEKCLVILEQAISISPGIKNKAKSHKSFEYLHENSIFQNLTKS